MAHSKDKVKLMTHYALFIAIILLLGLTPIGFLILPFAMITFVQVPVIIGGFSFGVRGGAIFGVTFGLVSVARCFMTPDPIAAIILGSSFYNFFLVFIIIFLPRVLTGITSALVYKAMPKKNGNNFWASALAGLVGSLTNTFMVIGGLCIFAFDAYAATKGGQGLSQMDFLNVIFGMLLFNGAIEAGVSMLLCGVIGRSVEPFVRRLRRLKLR